MIADLIRLYEQMKRDFFAGKLSDEDCETMQEISLILQSKGVTV